MSEWQPIETAPKDGTFVLIFNSDPISRVALAAWQGVGARAGWYGIDDLGLTFDAVKYGDVVTHFMHLPTPPNPVSENAE